MIVPAPNRATQISIDLGALANNLGVIRACAPQSALCAVVKGDAYGHGMLPVAQALEAAGSDWFAVVWLDDAIALRRAGITRPILLMGGDLRQASTAEAIVAHRLTPMVSQLAELPLLAAAAPPGGLAVHTEVDTGMSRLGVPLAELPAFWQALAAEPRLRLEGVMSHFVAADVLGRSENALQLQRWREVQALTHAAGFKPRWLHMAHSAATLSLPECHGALVRCGLMLYGLDPMAPPMAQRLRPVLSWEAKIISVRQIPTGTAVSYHARWRSQRPSRIATLPVGYTDGYPRLMTNRAHVLIRGQRLPVVGTICMDLCMVDITDVPEAQVGDPAVLLGKQGSQSITAADLAAWSETIPYEITCGISPRLPRRFIS